MIKDSQGIDRIVLQSDVLYNDDNIENKLESYEIIQILFKKKDDDDDYDDEKKNFVSKVVSKSNSKIYVLKKICKDYLPKEEGWEEKLKNNIKKINEISNMTKYYTYFYEKHDFYILSEFVENQDLEGFKDAYEKNNTPIEKEIIWNIFIQCLYGLKCLHEKGILHRNIKRSNIFMSDNKVIKIGDCGFDFKLENYQFQNDDYKSPELSNDEDYVYDEKCDIYSLGMVFLSLCFFAFKEYGEDMEEKMKEYYGEELISFIDKMINEDPLSRPSAKELYDSLKPQYIINISKLSSINSLFHCFFSFSNFSREMNLKANSFTESVTPISFNLYNCSQAFFAKENYDTYAVYLNNFRELFTKNIQIDNDTEIKPKLILDYLLEKLNKETANKLCSVSFGVQKIEFNHEKNISLKKFKENFENNFDSIIAHFFVGIIMTKRFCRNCGEEKSCLYSFNAFPSIEFDMDKCKNVKKVENWFKAQNEQNHILYKQENVLCDKCKKIQEHNEYKKFYSLPKNLIIDLNWGENKPYSFDIPEILDLTDNIIEDPFSPKKFNLVGIVKQLKDEKKNEDYYIAIYKDPFKEEKKWNISTKKENKESDNINDIEGIPTLLFYSAENKMGF